MITSHFIEISWTQADYIESVDYITDLKIRHGLNIVAMNGSYFQGYFSDIVADTYERANAANILLVAQAGQAGTFPRMLPGSNQDDVPHFTNDNIIVVTALLEDGSRISWANWGPNSVHIGAPGGVISTGMVFTGVGLPYVPGYQYSTGTDLAAAHVTGAAALYASLHPGSSAAQIKAAILASARPTRSLAKKTITGGRLDVSGF